MLDLLKIHEDFERLCGRKIETMYVSQETYAKMLAEGYKPFPGVRVRHHATPVLKEWPRYSPTPLQAKFMKREGCVCIDPQTCRSNPDCPWHLSDLANKPFFRREIYHDKTGFPGETHIFAEINPLLVTDIWLFELPLFKWSELPRQSWSENPPPEHDFVRQPDVPVAEIHFGTATSFKVYDFNRDTVSLWEIAFRAAKSL